MSRRGRPSLPSALALALAFAFSPAARCGVRLINPGEDMEPLPPLARTMLGSPDTAKAPRLETIKLAVVGGDKSLLAGLAPQAAPFEIVGPGDSPDLAFDPGRRQAVSKGEVVAFEATKDDLPAIVDRMAFARGIARLATERPQLTLVISAPLASAPGPLRRKGEKIEIELSDMTGRRLVLFAVSGDGLVTALYPIGADPRIVATPKFRWPFEIREPFGADLVVAVTSSQPLDALERGVTEASGHRSAGALLRLLAFAAPADARIGVAALLSAP